MTSLTNLLAQALPMAEPQDTPSLMPPVSPSPGRRRDMVKVVMVPAIASLPFLIPAGLGNTAPADVFLAAAIFISALWFSSHRQALRFPYLFPLGLSILAGALASTVAYSDAYVNVGGGLLILLQDAFLLAWAITIANIGRHPALLKTVTRAWAVSVTCWAVLMIIGVIWHIDVLSGQTAREGARASFTLADPNLAANYFICSLLVLRAARYPRRRILRWLCCAVIVTAIILTGSNGGALVLVIATVLGALFTLARRRGAAPAVITACGLVLAAGIIAPHVHVQAIVQKAQASAPLLKDSIGRQAESTGSRSTVLSETAQLYFMDDTPFGIGPGGTKGAFQAHQFGYVKMAHDDYAAAPVERGVLGGVALICLLVIVAARCRRIATRPLRPEYADIFPRPELLGAAVIGMFLSAFVYQVLHFRHLWALLGIVAALDLWGWREQDRWRPPGREAAR